MDSTRRANFEALLNGRFKRDRRRMCDALGLTNGRLTQLLDPAETFGETAAKRIEAKLGLAPGSLSREAEEVQLSIADAPPPPPPGFADRHMVNESDWALLQDIKDAMESPALAGQIEHLRSEVSALKKIGEAVYRRQLAATQAEHLGGMSNFGEFDSAPAPVQKKGSAK